ncbi:GNAT family N-acetyltransferase [Candidatus Bathyarchaeota archaeon]|nr:GNAT family N-acetyltransferase [Candidatus Bathyarchaeota archaeon]
MKIIPLDESLEKPFWNYVNQDPLHYYFFIVDWQQRRERTKILLAKEADKIEGMALIYADYIVQLRGNRKTVESLLSYVNLDRVELQAPIDCEDIILGKYLSNSPSSKHGLILMRLNKGEENLQVTNTPVRLGIEDAKNVVKIMAEADPEWWGDLTPETQRKTLETGFWLAIKQKGKLVSVGGTRFFDLASNISTVATDEHYRNRGHATSIVSGLVQEIFKHSPTAIIHVMRDNGPAFRAYSKVGFKPYRHYLLMRGERIKP